MSDAGARWGDGGTSTLRDRFRGTLVGLAVGDALGAPAEFLTAAQIRERWGLLDAMVGGGCHDVAPGETTDATDMALALAESLAERGGSTPRTSSAATSPGSAPGRVTSASRSARPCSPSPAARRGRAPRAAPTRCSASRRRATAASCAAPPGAALLVRRRQAPRDDAAGVDR